MAKSSKRNNKKHILGRYAFIVIACVVVGLGILFKLFETTVVEASAWNARSKAIFSKIDTIAPERGNLLSDNHNILACNLRVYDILLDLRHSKIQKMMHVDMDSVYALADSLDKYYPRRKDLTNPDSLAKYSWRTKLKREFEKDPEKRTRALRMVKNGSLQDYERVKYFPFIAKWYKTSNTPLYKTPRYKRTYPYGKMAYRSIGRVNQNAQTRQTHGYSGLERDLDSLLYGKPGLAKKVAMTSGIGNWTTTPPRRGYDICTTINIDLQDMLEEELHKICEEANAVWGTAILMEVKTGEIKAISNIEKLDDGTYGEALNRAVQAYEPGSVMKPISLMIAFEDGLVKNVTDMVDCSPFMRTNDPHGSGPKTMKQVIEQSSNTGIARVIFRGYAKNPEKWYDRLAGLGFFEPIRSGIYGECTPRIRRLIDHDSRGNNITMTARHLDLARQAYGYNTELPPLFTLSVYNAIANDGKYVRPHLVRSLIDENGRDSILPIQYIRPQICSPETAAKVRECIREVVWGEHGTARAVRDDRVEIAGKTGTAFPVENGQYNRAQRRYAFAGFFPYENPQYSCMALVLAGGGNSANRTSGQVVKNMAIKMYSRGMLHNASDYAIEKRQSKPVIAASSHDNTSRIANMTGARSVRRLKANDVSDMGRMPNLIGYDAASAIRIMEQRGINVRISGTGYVRSQSIPVDTPLRRGQTLVLRLKI